MSCAVPEPQVSVHMPNIPQKSQQESLRSRTTSSLRLFLPKNSPPRGRSAGNSRRWEGNAAGNQHPEHPKSTQAAPPGAPGPGFWAVPSGGTGMAGRADFPPRSRCSRERKGNQSYFGTPGLLFPPPGIPGVGIFTELRKMRGLSCCQNGDGTREFWGGFCSKRWECWDMGTG